jgi:putative membrane protein
MKYLCVLAMVFMYAACSNDDDDNANLNETDVYFMQQASYSNNAEITAGSIAASKGSYDSVRTYGTMMVSHHGEAQNALDSLASALSVSIPSTADSAHQAMAAYLQTLSGYSFDTAYINAQVKDHMATIAVFQKELSEGNNQLVLNYAQQNLPIIEMHLEEAQTIQQSIQ